MHVRYLTKWLLVQRQLVRLCQHQVALPQVFIRELRKRIDFVESMTCPLLSAHLGDIVLRATDLLAALLERLELSEY